MAIRVLAPEVAAKIAAGEVVERPASVVKELIENSIDAEATEIKVEVRQGGKRLIRVIDNGFGIPAGDVETALTSRYSTSKLEKVEDLSHIKTLGFRGEALTSIAAVSRLTIVTRAADEEIGTFMRLEGGKILNREGRGCPKGTVVTVENLFYNVPARLKFLRSEATERRYIDFLISRYALAYPEIRFSLLSDGRLTLQTMGSGDLYDVLIEVYGMEVAEQMLEVSGEEEIRVAGYISAPHLHRSSRNHISFFVNRRWVQDRMLSYAVEEAYHTLLPSERHPIVVLNVELSPLMVDVNVHPTKREIKFLKRDDVFVAVQKAVRRTLKEKAPVPSLALRPDLERRRRLVEVGRRRRRRVEMALEVQRTAEVEKIAPLTLPRMGKLPPLRVLGQLAQTYIIAEGPEGMYLIDQHTAHERVLYDKLMAERERVASSSQALLEPLTLELSSNQAAVVEDSMEILKELGFEIEPFGGGTYLVRAVPSMLTESDIAKSILEIIDELKEAGTGKAREEMAVISLVCHSAVKAGKVLSIEEMKELVRQLEETSLPHTCPHGRPTMIHLSQAQLEREFRRR